MLVSLLTVALLAASPQVVVARSDAATDTERASDAVMRGHIESEADVLETSLDGAPADPGARWQWARNTARERGAIAVVWAEPSGPDTYVLVLVAANGDLVRVREVARDSDNPAADGDALGLIAATWVATLVDSAADDVSRPSPAPRTLTAEPVPPEGKDDESAPLRRRTPALGTLAERAAWHRLRLSLGYRGTSFAAGAAWSSQLDGRFDAFVLPRMVVGVHYRWTIPHQVESDDVAFSVRRSQVGAGIGARVAQGERTSAEIMATGTLELLSHETRSTQAGLRGSTGHREVGVLGLRMAVHYALPRGLGLFGGLEFAALATRFDYVVFGPDGQSTRLSPHPFRGGVVGGLTYRFLLR